MAARSCIQCGNLVISGPCLRCGATQPFDPPVATPAWIVGAGTAAAPVIADDQGPAAVDPTAVDVAPADVDVAPADVDVAPTDVDGALDHVDGAVVEFDGAPAGGDDTEPTEVAEDAVPADADPAAVDVAPVDFDGAPVDPDDAPVDARDAAIAGADDAATPSTTDSDPEPAAGADVAAEASGTAEPGATEPDAPHTVDSLDTADTADTAEVTPLAAAAAYPLAPPPVPASRMTTYPAVAIGAKAVTPNPAGGDLVPFPPAPPPPAARDNWGRTVGAIAVIAVVTILVTAAVLLFRGQDSTAAASGITGSASVAAAPASVTPSGEPAPTADSSEPSVSVAGTSAAESPATDPTSSGDTGAAGTTTTPAESAEPQVKEIVCGPGYIVQIASSLTDTAFAARLQDLRDLGLLPAGASIAHTAEASCPIWGTSGNSSVLYAGPFQNAYDGCNARLTSPPDAFIRGMDTASSQEFVSCICPYAPAILPTVTDVMAPNVWIGELQRMLFIKLGVAELPRFTQETWGVLTPETSAALTSFQRDAGVPATGDADAATWTALQAAGCS